MLTSSPQLSWECHYRGWLQPAVAAQAAAAAGTAAELRAIGAAAGNAAAGTVSVAAGNVPAAAMATVAAGTAGPGAGWPAGTADVESPVSQVELLPDSLAWEEWDMQVGE